MAENELLTRVESVLDGQVRPVLQEHGGSVDVLGIADGIVRVLFTGHCGNCPSAALTLQTVVADALKGQIPEITDVVLVNGVSDELLNMANHLIKTRHES